MLKYFPLPTPKPSIYFLCFQRSSEQLGDFYLVQVIEGTIQNGQEEGETQLA